MLMRLALTIGLLSTPASATQEYTPPTLFDVAGVAAGDVLNVREGPDAGAPVIGTLRPDATRIEVVEERRGWGRVNLPERSGWVSLRFLAYRSDVWAEGTLPDGFACFGTEPFWSLRPQGDALVLSEPDAGDRTFGLRAILGDRVFRSPMRALVADGLTAVATPQLCSDGLSDRLFGLRAAIVEQGRAPRLLTGCCTIQPR